jgi:hypothetical protein
MRPALPGGAGFARAAEDTNSLLGICWRFGLRVARACSKANALLKSLFQRLHIGIPENLDCA